MDLSKTQEKLLITLHKGGDTGQIDGKTTRSSTFEALNRRGIISSKNGEWTLTESGQERVMSLIGENISDHRPNRVQFRWFDRHYVATFDIGQCDYAWWDKARRGAVNGLAIAGLFLKPLASKKAAWVLGQVPQFKYTERDEQKDETNKKVNEWFQEHHSEILAAMEESANLGDYYIVVNPDESVSVLTPDVVEPIVDENDYSKQIGWRIIQSFAHPQYPMRVQTIIDEYYENWRVRIVRGGSGEKRERFRNLTGLLPVFHIANNRHGGEMFGHPEGEPLVQSLHHYGEVLDAAVGGNLRQGRPTPKFERLGSQENVNAFIEAFGKTETRTLDDGTIERYTVMEFSSDQVVYLGENGTFDYASPQSFTADTMNILQILFYLFIQHTELPEFIWGGAINASKASAEAQLPPFVKWAEKEQGRAEQWLIPLVIYITVLKSLYDIDVKYKEGEKPKVRWFPLSEGDGKLTLEAIKVALTMGKWKPEWVVPYMPLDIDNPEEIIQGIIEQAEEEETARQENEVPFVPSSEPSDMADDNADSNTNGSSQDKAEIVKRAQMVLSETEHSGAMVAFEIDLDTAASLVNAARQSGLDAVAPEELHLTLAFMPGRDEDKRDDIENALRTFANSGKAIEGTIGGIGRFNASEFSDGMDVIYASFDAPDLPEFRQDLIAALNDTGAVVATNHGFTPHITLAYVEKNSDMPPLFLETIPLSFDAVTLYWGDERVRFDLGEKVEERIVV